LYILCWSVHLRGESYRGYRVLCWPHQALIRESTEAEPREGADQREVDPEHQEWTQAWWDSAGAAAGRGVNMCPSVWSSYRSPAGRQCLWKGWQLLVLRMICCRKNIVMTFVSEWCADYITIDSNKETKALFSSEKISDFATIALLFLFDKLGSVPVRWYGTTFRLKTYTIAW